MPAIELVRQLIESGDEQAYRQFARLFHGRFYRFFLVSDLPPFEAEDAARTLITDIVIKFDKYKPRDGASFESWIFQLMRIAAANWHRSRKGQRFEPLGTLASTLPNPESGESWVHPELITGVQSALEKLSSDDRIILELRDLGEDRLHEEIAQLMGITVGTARVRYFRARKRLRVLLELDERVTGKLSAAANP